jgi:23S rRNA pseudouridine1911/1915/1917 synthase
MNKHNFISNDSSYGSRLDKFLALQFLSIDASITRSKIQQFIKDRLVLIDDVIVDDVAYQLKNKPQNVAIDLPKSKQSHLLAVDIAFEIIYQDEHLLVINKPANLTVHPGNGNQQNTLVNGLLFSQQKLSTSQDPTRPGIVHRLDKNTSGLMLVAKNDLTHLKLSKMLQERLINRTYLAFIYGVITPQQGTINKNICRNANNRLKMITCKQTGKTAISHYKTLQIFGNNFASLLECKLKTGRTHQIRVHFESEKHSLIGDQLYNSCQKMLPSNCSAEFFDYIKQLNRQALHSTALEFVHPITAEKMHFTCQPPEDLAKLHSLLNSLNQ